MQLSCYKVSARLTLNHHLGPQQKYVEYVFKCAHTLSPYRIKQSNQISILFPCQNLQYYFALAGGNLAMCYSPQACLLKAIPLWHLGKKDNRSMLFCSLGKGHIL